MSSRRAQRMDGGAGAPRCLKGRLASRGAVALLALLGVLVLWCGSAQALENVPSVEDQYVTDVSGSSATLGGQLNPEGHETTYRFEYGPSISYGSSTPERDAGSGFTAYPVLAHVQGLQARTVYHYRLVATSSVGTTFGSDQTFTTQSLGSELSLLDDRQWELVSPPNKHGAAIKPLGEPGVIEAAEDGHSLSYVVTSPTELEPDGYTEYVQVLSRRGAGSWSSVDIATKHDAPTGQSPNRGGEYRFFSPDLSLALVEPRGATPLSPEATEQTEYVRRNEECEVSLATCYTPLLTAANVAAGTEFGSGLGVHFVGATPDLRHVVLRGEVNGPLTSTPGDNGKGLYEWTNGQLQLVSVLPESEGGAPDSYANLGYGAGEVARNAISSDGSRIFWTGSNGGLYMRDMARGETIRIGGPGQANYQAASADGSRVFFTRSNTLEACDIVEVAGKLACDTTQLATGVQGLLSGVSEDGSYVYFASGAALASGAVSDSCERATEVCNLYMVHDDGTGWGPRSWWPCCPCWTGLTGLPAN